MKVAEKWKLGSAEKDTGVLLLIALEERSIRIEVGYGLEGILTDTKCGLIIRNIIAPEFRNGNYQAGIVNAIKNIEGLVKNDESLVSKKVLSEDRGMDPGGFIFAGVALLYGFIFVMAIISSKKSQLINTLPLRTVEIVKDWNDDNNRDGIRPEKITINLFANGEKFATKEVTAADEWKYTFKDLDKYKNGDEVIYSIEEEIIEETKIEMFLVKFNKNDIKFFE